MKYYNYEQFKQMKKKAFNWKIDGILNKYFDDTFGADVLCDMNGNVDTIEICKLSDVSVNSETWTHYANIVLWDDGTWEVNSQFNGEREDEMWVYVYYKRFADACKCVANGKFENMKPIKIY